MYIVKDDKGEVVAICTRLEDAQAYESTALDETVYTIEETPCSKS